MKNRYRAASQFVLILLQLSIFSFYRSISLVHHVAFYTNTDNLSPTCMLPNRTENKGGCTLVQSYACLVKVCCTEKTETATRIRVLHIHDYCLFCNLNTRMQNCTSFVRAFKPSICINWALQVITFVVKTQAAGKHNHKRSLKALSLDMVAFEAKNK